MPFFFNPMFLPSMWIGTVLAFMPLFAMMIPASKQKCVILEFPKKKVLVVR
jgi:hypothetical protein